MLADSRFSHQEDCLAESEKHLSAAPKLLCDFFCSTGGGESVSQVTGELIVISSSKCIWKQWAVFSSFMFNSLKDIFKVSFVKIIASK